MATQTNAQKVCSAIVAAMLALQLAPARADIEINNTPLKEVVPDILMWLLITLLQDAAKAPEEEALKLSARAVHRLARAHLATAGSDRADLKLTHDAIQQLQSRLQSTLDVLVVEVKKIQEQELIDTRIKVRDLTGGVQVIVKDSPEVNAKANTGISKVIEVPLGLVTSSAYLLLKRQLLEGPLGELPDDADEVRRTDFHSDRFKYALEFEEIIRFVLAHELVHIWLDQSSMLERDREIEADAWGIILSAQLSPVVDYRAKLLRTSNQDNSDYQVSLRSARAGPEILLFLYEFDGVFAANKERQDFEERLSSVKTKSQEVVAAYARALSRADIRSFDTSAFFRTFRWPIGDEDAR